MSTIAPVSLAVVKAKIRKEANKEKTIILGRFFKTGKGEYAEGDRFVGVTVPVLRRIVKETAYAPLEVAEALLQSKIHEERFVGLQIMVTQFVRGDAQTQTLIYQRYLKQIACVNNWDLVDSTAPQIIGTFLLHRDRELLYRLARSPVLWERRIAIIATLAFIRVGEFDDTMRLAELLLSDSHDLMHKAVGWMLREVGKRDERVLRKFLAVHAQVMPRTMLRYAIERLPERERRQILIDSSR